MTFSMVNCAVTWYLHTNWIAIVQWINRDLKNVNNGQDITLNVSIALNWRSTLLVSQVFWENIHWNPSMAKREGRMGRESTYVHQPFMLIDKKPETLFQCCQDPVWTFAKKWCIIISEWIKYRHRLQTRITILPAPYMSHLIGSFNYKCNKYYLRRTREIKTRSCILGFGLGDINTSIIQSPRS